MHHPRDLSPCTSLHPCEFGYQFQQFIPSSQPAMLVHARICSESDLIGVQDCHCAGLCAPVFSSCRVSGFVGRFRGLACGVFVRFLVVVIFFRSHYWHVSNCFRHSILHVRPCRAFGQHSKAQNSKKSFEASVHPEANALALRTEITAPGTTFVVYCIIYLCIYTEWKTWNPTSSINPRNIPHSTIQKTSSNSRNILKPNMPETALI